MGKVVVMGELCEDTLMHNPESVAVLGIKTWAEDITVTAGGSASYAAQALSHLGNEVSICSVLGDDRAGERTRWQLEGCDIDCSMIYTLKGRKTTGSMLVCRGGEKTFLGCSPMLPFQLPLPVQLKGANLLYVAGYMLYPELWTDAAYTFFETVVKEGVRMVVDVQMLPLENIDPIAMSRFDRLLRLTDTVLIARKEARQITGGDDPEVLRRLLLPMGVKTIIFKQGAQGCIVMNEQESVKVEGYVCPDIYDSIGSGDVFGGSYCHYLMKGESAVQSARFATIFAALSLGRYYEMKNFPRPEVVEDILSKR